MTHRQGGHKTNKLVFPSNWTGKWLYRTIINTPKWQINSVLGSYKYDQWTSFESTYLNGLKLPERTSPEENYLRSVIVGIKVSQASKDYKNMMNEVPLEDKIELLKDELSTPIVGDMIRTLTTFVAPIPSPRQELPNVVNVEFPETKIEEKGKMVPVQIIE